MPKRKLPPNEEVIEMYRSGMSSGEIAEVCGVKPITVQSLFRRLGVQMRSTEEASRLKVERGRCVKTRYWQGKKQSPEMVERRISKIRGENHYLWKGGTASRQYRNVVQKEQCESCSATENLVIHHIDLDHYNNDPSNLQVLCASCHQSLHKKMYWDAYHRGEQTPKSNGPVGWTRNE